jgi:hypothetical protein
MDVILAGAWANPRMAGAEALARASDAYLTQMGEPLRLTVPTQGIQFAFEKLYANQSTEDAAFSVRYVSSETNKLGLVLSAFGALLLWFGIVALASRRFPIPRFASVASLVSGLACLIAPIGYLGTSPILPSAVALLVGLGLTLWWGISRLRARGHEA